MDPSLFVAIVLVTAGLLALEFGISSAITEIVAGVLLALFIDVTPMDWLSFLAGFGMLGLMFMAGFEVDPAVLRQQWRPSVGIGIASFSLPAAGVYAVCRWGLGLQPGVGGLVAIGLSTTSLALVYQFLRERDLLAGEVGQTILGAAMVVDLLSMIALALLLGDLGWATAIFAIAAVPAFWGLPRFGEWIFARYRGNVVEFEVRFLLMALVGLGFLAEHAGIHAAIVSFAAGLVLGEVVQDHAGVEQKMKGVVFSFFAPIFFLRAGTQLDLREIDLPTVGITVVLLAVAAGLKYAGTTAAARLLSPAVGQLAGVLFNYRLTFGIITATVGFQEGLLNQRLFSAMLMIVLVTTLLPMVLLRDLPAELSR